MQVEASTMVLRGTTPLLSTQGHVVLLVVLMELCFPPPLEAAGDPNIVLNFDPITILGGGMPGQDYPILARVPDTGFSCAAQQFPGYYADTAAEAACQVFHICQADGRQDSFLCPNGTVFSQQYLVCDWWYSVDCTPSTKSGRRPATIVPSSNSEESVTFLSGGSEVASVGAGTIIRPPHHALPPPVGPITVHSHQQIHHTLPSPTSTPKHHSPPPTTFIPSQQPNHQSLPQATASQSHQPSHHILPQSSAQQTHHSAHQSIPHHSVIHSRDSPQQSISQSSATQSHHSTHHILPQPSVTHSPHSTLQSSPRPTVTHNDQSITHSLSQATVSQNHHTTQDFPSQSFVTHHSQVQTLFREDIPPSLVLRPHPPSRRETPSNQSLLSPRPGSQPDGTNTNAYSIPSEDDRHHTFLPQFREQANTFTASHQQEVDHVDHSDESVTGLNYSLESANFLTSASLSREDERVEYDNVYSATLFPPNIPPLGDVYEAAKGRVIVDVVKESYDGNPFLPPSKSVQKDAHTKSTPLHVPKDSQRVKGNLGHSQPAISDNLSKTQDLLSADKSLPNDSFSVKDTIIPSPQDHNPLYRPPQTNHEPFSGHSVTQSIFKTPDDSPSKRHESFVPHHVWRPTHDHFVALLDTALALDDSLNLIDSPLQPHDTFTVTSKPSPASYGHPTSHESFKVLHETPLSGHEYVTSHHLFPRKQGDARNSQKLPSVTHESFEASDYTLPNSHESFLVIHETSPAVHDASVPPSPILFHSNDVSDSQELSNGIPTAFKASDHSHESFAVIHESSLTVHDASSPHQPLPTVPHHRLSSRSFQAPHRSTLQRHEIL